jgi:uncharacterized protein YdeI (YjbR/CyaY-like superfamily)
MNYPAEHNSVYCPDREDWRAWLQANHDSAPEVWLIFYKRSTGKPTLSYDAAVEEALCFGWIDGIQKGLDADRYTLRFTPRKPKSNWSESNKRRVRQLITDGCMTPAGLAKVTFSLTEIDPDG